MSDRDVLDMDLEDEENEEVSKHHSFLDRARTLYKILNISFDSIIVFLNMPYGI